MKSIARSVGAVLAGYVIFAAVSFGSLTVTSAQPDDFPGIAILVVVSAISVVGALAGRYVLGRLAPSKKTHHGAFLAGVLALIAIISLVAQWGETSPWTQILGILFLSPALLLGSIAADQ